MRPVSAVISVQQRPPAARRKVQSLHHVIRSVLTYLLAADQISPAGQMSLGIV